MACEITNIGECIAEAIFGFILDILNMASEPFLNLIKKFLTEPVSITAFADIWGIIVYILSMFYGLFLVWIGIKFIISGEYPEEREKAKSDLKSIIIMMVLVQGSYHLYELFLAVSASLTKVVFNMIPSSFFRLTLESVSNFGFDLIFGIIYILHLIAVLVLVLLRHIYVSAGVILFAIGIFFYFMSPLNSYGKLILNGLGVMIFLPFFYSIVFLVGSRIAELREFRNLKTLIMVGTLDIIILFTLLLLLFVIFKAATKVSKVAKILT